MIDAKSLVEYLTYGDADQSAKFCFDEAFRNKIDLLIDPSVLQHSVFKNMDWSNAKNMTVFDGENSYPMMSWRRRDGQSVTVIKLEERVYTRIIPEEICTTLEYGERLRDILSFIHSSGEIRLSRENILINDDDPRIQRALGSETVRGFISDLASAGWFTLTSSCTVEDNIQKYVFGVYKNRTMQTSYLTLRIK